MTRRGRWGLLLALVLVWGCATAPTKAANTNAGGQQAVRLDGFAAIEPDVLFSEHAVARGDASMRLWTYAPADAPTAPASRGLVLIAPAGSNLLTGMKLGEADQAEHLPYARAGYVVVAYEIDGALPEDGTEAEAAVAFQRFFEARMGVDNASAALDDALKRLPEIDPKRVFTVGHSSAATLALQVAAIEQRIRGVVAFAPVSDLRSHFAELFASVDPADPIVKALDEMSPLNLASRISVALLFHARDDSVVPFEQTRAMEEAIRSAGGDAKLEAVASGDHYDAMIDKGIPSAIAWLDTQR